MEIIYNLSDLKKEERLIATIGSFDGIHLGHRKIVETVLKRGKEENAKTSLITFEPDPKVYFSKKNISNGILTTSEDKIGILKEFSLDKLIFIPFDKKVAGMSPELFLKEIVINQIGAFRLIIGYDHAFGKDRSGTLPVIKKLSNTYGFEIEIIQPFMVEKTIVSSTLIRNLLTDGKVEKARFFIGRYYALQSTVVKGKGRGQKIGFPTANFSLTGMNKLIPKTGIYAARISLEGEFFWGMVYIGNKPTFNEKELCVEVHIFNYKNELYGRKLTVEFLKRIRDDKKFKNAEELKIQMENDKKETLYFLKNLNWEKSKTSERLLENVSFN